MAELEPAWAQPHTAYPEGGATRMKCPRRGLAASIVTVHGQCGNCGSNILYCRQRSDYDLAAAKERA